MTPQQKQRQFDHQGGLCCWCVEPMLLVRGDANPLAATREHIQPRSKGGTDDLANIVLAHSACNHKRGNKHDRLPRFMSYTLGARRQLETPTTERSVGADDSPANAGSIPAAPAIPPKGSFMLGGIRVKIGPARSGYLVRA